MTDKLRDAAQQALEALASLLNDATLVSNGTMAASALTTYMTDAEDAITALRAALAGPQQAAEPFTPDWTNYRQGLADGWAEGYEQGVKDERTSEDNIGIAGFGAKVDPARQNPYGKPQPAQQDAQAVVQGWRVERVSDDDVRVCGPDAETWLLCANAGKGTFEDFAYRFFFALASCPQPEAAPAVAQQDAQPGSPDHGELYAQGWLNGTQVQSLIDWCSEVDRKPPNIAYTSGPVRQLAYAIAAAVWRSYRAGMEASARLCDDRVDESANQQRNAAFRNDPYGQKRAMLDGEVAKWLAIEIRAKAKATEASLPWDVATPPAQPLPSDQFAGASKLKVDSPSQQDTQNAADEVWRKLFWQAALKLKCLPSSYPDANGHVLRAIDRLMGSENAQQDAQEVFKRLDADMTKVLHENSWELYARDAAAPTPPAQRVMLTYEEISRIYTEQTGAVIEDSPWALHDFAYGVIEAYERKSGIWDTPPAQDSKPKAA